MTSVTGVWRDHILASRQLAGEVSVRIWSPPEPTGRLLVVHDGPAYEQDAGLVDWIQTAGAPPCHVTLLEPGDRTRWYAADPAYGRALTGEVLPWLRRRLGVHDRVVGVGASLGALALLHAQRLRRGSFGGLFLQSGSFFKPSLDSQERGFAGYRRVTRFVRRVERQPATERVPVVMTCGVDEENLANNRAMAVTLAGQGYPVRLREVPGGHNFTSWRAALRLYLPELLTGVWR